MPDFDLTVSDGWLMVLLAPIFLALAYLSYRSDVRGFGKWLLGLRAAALVLVLLLLLEPLLALTVQTQRKPLIAVLIDDSESMQFADGDRARYEVVQALLDGGVFDVLEDRARVAFFRFSDRLYAMSPGEVLTWDGRATDLASALDGVREQTAGDGLVGVVLISDGGHNLGGRPERAAAELGVPLFAVGVGDPEPPKDVAIVSAVVDPLGYVGRALALQVRLRATGFEQVQTAVRVMADGQEVASRSVMLYGGEQTLDLEWVPERPGRYAYEISVPPQLGERTVVNNRAVVSVEVLESRLRALLLAGSPSADLAYLRRVLESDPHLELDMVVRLQPSGWGRDVQVALRDVQRWDVVVMVNVPQAELAGLPEQQLVDFVQSGGGLLVVGGDAAFEARYALSPLSRVLPLRFERASGTFQEAAFGVVLPDVERRHPVMRFSDDPLSDRDAWAALPPLLSYNRVAGASDQATVLIAHDTERIQGRPMPLVAVQQAGRGKTMAVAFRTFWRYGLMAWGMGKTDALSQAFWHQAVRWLVSREDVSRVRASVDQSSYRSGEPVAVHAQVFDALMTPLSGARVQVVVPDSAGRREVMLRDVGDGRYTGILGGFDQGDYTFQVRATAPDGIAEEGEGHFTVGRYSLEYESVRLHAELLAEMAAHSGGQYLEPDDLAAHLTGLELVPEPITEYHRVRLWGQRWPLFVLVGLLGLEWIARRRRGMI